MMQNRTRTQNTRPDMSTRHTATQKRNRRNAAARAARALNKEAKAAAEKAPPMETARTGRRPAVIEITGEPKPGDTLRIGDHLATFRHISERKPLNEHEAARLEQGLQKSAENNRELFLAAREVDRLKAELAAAEHVLKSTREENGRILAEIAPLFQRLPA